MITPERLLEAYASGYFPMAESRHSEALHWFNPSIRGVLPLDARFHVPRRLQRWLCHCPYRITIDTAFAQVIRACADTRARTRDETWINDTIIRLYRALFERGHAHSVECWQEEWLVGGLYGVSLGGAFFGESMFSLAPNASKAALVHLVERLRAAGHMLCDTQYVNPHLMQFGVVEMPRADYLASLAKALNVSPNPSARFCTLSDIKS